MADTSVATDGDAGVATDAGMATDAGVATAASAATSAAAASVAAASAAAAGTAAGTAAAATTTTSRSASAAARSVRRLRVKWIQRTSSMEAYVAASIGSTGSLRSGARSGGPSGKACALGSNSTWL